MKNDSGVQPIGYRILVKPLEVEERTAGGIIIPDASKDQKQWRQSRGTVIAIGELAFTQGTRGTGAYYEYRVKPEIGDVVRYREYAGLNWTDKNDERFTLLDDSDVIAVEIDE